jgi:hypothetical protein
MARQNITKVRPAVHSPVTSETTPSGHTYEGGPGFARDMKSELFLLAVANFVGEDTFYEDAQGRDTRFADLVQSTAQSDSAWTARLLRWLRSDANMRTASIVGAAEYVKATQGFDNVQVPPRQVVNSVIQRADEPGEMLAYWLAKYGKAIPKPIKRGIGDAILRLGTEFNYLKWDGESRGVRFADVLNLVHPGDRKGSAQHIRGDWQHDLFGYAVKRPHQDGLEIPETLGMLTRRQALMAMPVDERRRVLESPETLREAGMTWESLAGWLQGPMDKAAWEAIIPSMGYMALLRNLRNFDQAGVSDQVAQTVMAKLADPEQVAKSRQLPMRFLSAYRAAASVRWAWPLEQALGHSLRNIPQLGGRTLILVDTSTSMDAPFSKDGTLMRWDAAVSFGLALATRCEKVDVVSFSTGTKAFPIEPGESVLRGIERWQKSGFFFGGGTETQASLRRHFAGHDRVLILTDEQAAWGTPVGHDLPNSTSLYTWNLAGYKMGHNASGSGNRHTFGGLTDAAFRMIPLLEAGRNGDWDAIFGRIED